MKYFIPEWDDRVDPGYNFLTDAHSREHKEDPVKNDVYTWNIFGLNNVPIDGVLVSRMTLMQNKTKYERALREGIHSTLRLPPNFEIMGDCGAFGYVDEVEPPFKTKEVLDYYVNSGFNYGVSVDHLIVPAHSDENERRWEITLENAKEMFEYWASKDRYLKSLRIIGVAQGWDVDSYRRAVKELLDIGYDYIGLGGLVRSPTRSDDKTSQSKTVLNVLKGTWLETSKWMEKSKSKIDVHLFGVARPEILQDFVKYGITSFDSASFLRRAWLGASSNYHTLGGKMYAALRVMFQEEDGKLKSLEQESLKKIRLFAKNQIEKEDVVKVLEIYEIEMLREEIFTHLSQIESPEKVLGKGKEIMEGTPLTNGQIEEFVNGLELEDSKAEKIKKILKRAVAGVRRIDKLREHYNRTLTETPWKKCDCPICKNVGVEVIVFRGNNRNRRRGFHNTYAFYQRFRRSIPKIFVFTNCTMRKDERAQLIPAFQRYLKSPPFKVFWNNVFDLPVEIGVLSAKFGLIDWSQRIPDYNYKMQESDVPKFVEELEAKLKRYDKIFFIGLGLYKDVVQRVRDETNLDIEIYPKLELTTREHLDILEYTKQMKFLREAIVQSIPEKCRPSEEISTQRSLKGYME